jgi:hypothetical protein
MTGEIVATAMTLKMRLIAVSALVGVVLSAALMALSFVTHSIWPIVPGVYIVASAVGIHSASMVAAALVNAFLIWIAAIGFMALYGWKSNR